MRNRAALAAGIVLGLTACGSAAERPTHLQAETTFLAPYVFSRSISCEGRALELRLMNRPAYVILTLPPIDESEWQLMTCKDHMSFVLDCSDHGDGYFCTAHDWPLPLEAQESNEVSHEIATVMDLAPRCPREKSCMKDKERCAEDGITIRRFDDRVSPNVPASADYATGFYEVERCGLKRTVGIRCLRRSPFTCATSTRDVAE